MRSALILVMASFILLSACGQKGALYLTEDQISAEQPEQKQQQGAQETAD
ncbi:LPS translocon maturation chaperone LptM [Candidatus Spongiihabitans sp.]